MLNELIVKQETITNTRLMRFKIITSNKCQKHNRFTNKLIMDQYKTMFTIFLLFDVATTHIHTPFDPSPEVPKTVSNMI